MTTAVTITRETLAVIAASVTAFLGKKVRIRSARELQTPYAVRAVGPARPT